MNRLKELRLNRKLSLRQLESEVGIANSTLSEMENGIRPMAPKHAKILAPFFGVTEEYIMGDDIVKAKTYDFDANEWVDSTHEIFNNFLQTNFDKIVTKAIKDELDERTRLNYVLIDRILNDGLSIEELNKLNNLLDTMVKERKR